MNDNLKTKLADEHIKFLQSPMWAIIRYRLLQYQKRQEEYSATFTRNGNNHGAILNLGMADGTQASIRLIEGLNREIMENTLDADAALHVIENKAEK
jgi:hypothetical protein